VICYPSPGKKIPGGIVMINDHLQVWAESKHIQRVILSAFITWILLIASAEAHAKQ